MQHENENAQAVVSFWKRANYIEQDKRFPDVKANDLIASIFNPGKYFYILVNFFDLRIEYVHSTIEEHLGINPADFTSLVQIFDIMHPDDIPQV